MLSKEKLADLRERFPCLLCNGTEIRGTTKCGCAKGINWPAAYVVLGQQLERERAHRQALAIETIRKYIDDHERGTDETGSD